MKILKLCLIALCISGHVSSQNQQVIDSLQKVIQTTTSKKHKADAYNLIALEYINDDSSKIALYTFESIKISHVIGYQAGVIDAYYLLGWITMRRAHYSKAIQLFEQNLKLAKMIDYKKGEANAYNGLGVTHRYQGNYALSLRFYQKSAIIKKKIGDKKGIAGNYHNIATIYKIQGNYPKALKYYQQALAVNQLVRNKKWMGFNYAGIGEIYYLQGKLPKALKVHLRSLKLKEEINDKRGLTNSYYRIGLIYQRQGDYSKALEFYQHSVQFGEQIKDSRIIASCFNNIGEIYLHQGNLIEAGKMFQKALQLKESMGDKRGVAASYFSLGKLALKQQKLVQAQQHFKKVLTMRRQMGEKALFAEALIKLGTTYFYQKNYFKALENLEQGIQIAKKLGNIHTLRDGAEILSKIHFFQRNLLAAYKYQVLFKKMADSLFNEKNTRTLGRMEAKYTFGKTQDSLQLIQVKEKALFNADIKQRKFVQATTFIGLGLTLALILVLIFFYRQKILNNNQLNLANQQLENFNGKLQDTHQEIKLTNEALELQKEEIMTQHDAIEQQNNLLSAKNLHISQSIKAAKIIQDAILPFETRMKKTLGEYFVLYRPKDIVSGDFYWLGQVQNKRIVAVVDCTGHGVAGAFMSIIGFTLLNEIINIRQTSNPAKILEYLRHDIRYALQQDETGSSSGMDVGLVAFEEVDNQQIQVSFAGAKRPLWYIPKSSKKTQLIKGSMISIGITYKKNKTINEETFVCAKGTVLYLSSDGFADQNNVGRKKFGTKQLTNLLFQNCNLPLVTQKQLLENELDKHMTGTEQRDDILLLGIEV